MAPTRFKTHSFSRNLLFILVLYRLFGIPVEGFGDTYNFYFDKKNKKQAPVGTQMESEEEDPELPRTGRVSKAKEAPPTVPLQPQPIIINNINNNDNANRNNVSAPNPLGVGATPLTTRPLEEEETSLSRPAISSEIPSVRPNPWKYHFGGVVGAQRYLWYQAWYDEAPAYHSDITFGAMGSLSYSSSRSVDWRFYGGALMTSNGRVGVPFAGIDLELSPIRIAFSDQWDLFRLGIFAGASTLAAVPGKIGTLHGGVRATVNVGPWFGITASGRINYGYAMFEAGITTSL